MHACLFPIYFSRAPSRSEGRKGVLEPHSGNVLITPVRTSGPTGRLGHIHGNLGEFALLLSTLALIPQPQEGKGSDSEGGPAEVAGCGFGKKKWGLEGACVWLASLLRGCPQPQASFPLRTPAAGIGRTRQGLIPRHRSHLRHSRRWGGGPGPPPGSPPRLLRAARRARPRPLPPRGAPAPLSSPSGLGGALYSHPGLGFALMRNVINPEKRAERQERRRGRGGGRRARGARGTESLAAR